MNSDDYTLKLRAVLEQENTYLDNHNSAYAAFLQMYEKSHISSHTCIMDDQAILDKITNRHPLYERALQKLAYSDIKKVILNTILQTIINNIEHNDAFDAGDAALSLAIIEQYAINLLCDFSRVEYHTIRMDTYAYYYRVERGLMDAFSIINLLGFEKDNECFSQLILVHQLERKKLESISESIYHAAVLMQQLSSLQKILSQEGHSLNWPFLFNFLLKYYTIHEFSLDKFELNYLLRQEILNWKLSNNQTSPEHHASTAKKDELYTIASIEQPDHMNLNTNSSFTEYLSENAKRLEQVIDDDKRNHEPLKKGWTSKNIFSSKKKETKEKKSSPIGIESDGAKENQWECPHCKFINFKKRQICDSCSKTPLKEPKIPIGGLSCLNCNLVNDKKKKNCCVCDASLKDCGYYL